MQLKNGDNDKIGLNCIIECSYNLAGIDIAENETKRN